MTASADFAVEARGLTYQWPGADQATLQIPELRISRGEKLFLEGPSGSGKSTLLGLIGGVLPKQGGSLSVLGHSFSEMSSARVDRFRADHIGFVFQSFNLLPYLSIKDNIETPLLFSEKRRKKVVQGRGVQSEILHLCESLSLPSALLDQEVARLSVGQQQRVAVARALLGSPEILIADEPTSALDTATRNRFIELLLEESSQRETTVIFVSHDASLSSHFDKTLSLTEINQVSTAEQSL